MITQKCNESGHQISAADEDDTPSWIKVRRALRADPRSLDL